MEGNLHFKINWASLIVGRKFTFFALFYFVFEGNFQVQAPRGAYIWRGDLKEGFLHFLGLIFGGAYTWRGLFSRFYGMLFTSYSRIGARVQVTGLVYSHVVPWSVWLKPVVSIQIFNTSHFNSKSSG